MVRCFSCFNTEKDSELQPSTSKQTPFCEQDFGQKEPQISAAKVSSTQEPKSNTVSCCPPGAAPYLAADHNDEGCVGVFEGVSYYQVGSGEIGLLLCPDVWGWNGGRTRALADELAKTGLSVWVPKILNAYQGGTDGDGLPPNFNVVERGDELGPLIGGDWNPSVTVPKTLKVVECMRKAGVKKIGCLGFCYGGWIGFKVAQQVQLVCGATPHPSVHLEGMVGGDPAALAATSSCPWALFPCGEIDGPGSDPGIYDPSGVLYKALDTKFPGQNMTKRFGQMHHGFATRGAIKPNEFNAGTGDHVKQAVQECINDIVSFFKMSGLYVPKPALQISCCPPGAAPYLAADHNDEGRVGVANGVSYYQVGSGSTGLLLCPDVWGWNGGRTRALADELAKAGLSVWVPKILKAYQGGTDGDGLPPNFNVVERGDELGPLIGGDWNPSVTVPKTLQVVECMKKAGVKKIGCLGFCYGGWIGFKVSQQVELVCGATPHPSVHLEGMVGGDPAALAATSSCPWALFPCGEIDGPGSDPGIYDPSGVLYKALDAKFPGQNMTKRFSNMHHGFATRGAIKPTEFNAGTGDDVKQAVQECITDIVSFFKTSGLLMPKLNSPQLSPNKVSSVSCCPPGAAPYLAADHKDEGRVGVANGVSYYQVGSGETGLLLCPDVWGWNGGRTRALADEFAKAGLNVFVPKLLTAYQGGTDGDGLPPNFNVVERGDELGPLIGGDWNPSVTVPKTLKVVEGMKKAGVKRIACLGFCYGGWIGFKVAQEIDLVCGATPHPSVHLEGMVGGDPAALASTSSCPWALFPCGEIDGPGSDPTIYDPSGVLYKALDTKFPGQNMTKRFSTMHHGFATRGAIKPTEFNAGTGDDVKQAVQECVNDILGFFKTSGLFAPKPAISCCPPGSAPYLAADHNDEGRVGVGNGVAYYQVGSGDVGLLICPDVWGWNGGRTRALADELSKFGLNVWVPKLLTAYQGGTDGDGLPPDFNVVERGDELGPLIGGDWNPSVTVPKTLKVVECMKQAGVKRIGCLGFCYGGWIGFKVSQEVQLVCGATPHPSVHLEGMVGGDPAALASTTSCPWALFPCGEVDGPGSDPGMYDTSGALYKALEAKYPNKNVTKRFTKMHHGFATRGAIKPTEFNAGSGDDVKQAVQECINDIVSFYKTSGLLPTHKL